MAEVMKFRQVIAGFLAVALCLPEFGHADASGASGVSGSSGSGFFGSARTWSEDEIQEMNDSESPDTCFIAMFVTNACERNEAGGVYSPVQSWYTGNNMETYGCGKTVSTWPHSWTDDVSFNIDRRVCLSSFRICNHSRVEDGMGGVQTCAS